MQSSLNKIQTDLFSLPSILNQYPSYIILGILFNKMYDPFFVLHALLLFIIYFIVLFIQGNIVFYNTFEFIMNKKNKATLIFSIIYWIVALVSITLFAVAFKKVPIGYYGLKAAQFNPDIQKQYYIPGLYNVGVGFYFILFPSNKQYITDNKVTVTNRNLQPLQVTYTLIYRIDPDKIYQMYQTMGYNYQNNLIAAANNLISSQLINIQQQNSRITIQSSIVNQIATSVGNKIVASIPAILVEAFFIQQITFPENIQNQYEKTIRLSDSYQESYQATKVQYQKTILQVAAVQQQIALIKQNFIHSIQRTYKQQFTNILSTELSNYKDRQTQISSIFQLKRLWNYYNSTRLIFKAEIK